MGWKFPMSYAYCFLCMMLSYFKSCTAAYALKSQCGVSIQWSYHMSHWILHAYKSVPPCTLFFLFYILLNEQHYHFHAILVLIRLIRVLNSYFLWFYWYWFGHLQHLGVKVIELLNCDLIMKLSHISSDWACEFVNEILVMCN